jgi:hypothetical protein
MSHRSRFLRVIYPLDRASQSRMLSSCPNLSISTAGYFPFPANDQISWEDKTFGQPTEHMRSESTGRFVGGTVEERNEPSCVRPVTELRLACKTLRQPFELARDWQKVPWRRREVTLLLPCERGDGGRPGTLQSFAKLFSQPVEEP